jgi:hypothetical protein
VARPNKRQISKSKLQRSTKLQTIDIGSYLFGARQPMKFLRRFCGQPELLFSLSPRESTPVGYCRTSNSHQI